MPEVHDVLVRELHDLVIFLAAEARGYREQRGKLEPGSHQMASFLSGKEFASAEASRLLQKITRHLPEARPAGAASDEQQEPA